MIALLAAFLVSMHPIHTSVLELRWDARTGELSGTVRVFEDDLTLASNAVKLDATAYVLSKVGVRDGDRDVAFTACGARRVADAVLVCVRARVGDRRSVRIRNAVLMDLHADQVNIVRVQGNVTSTLLLTAREPERSVGL